MTARGARWTALAALAVLVAVAAWAAWRQRGNDPSLVAFTAHPAGIMGSECTLVAVVTHREQERAEAALAAAERELRRIEALASSSLGDSEISQLNGAAAEVEVPLSNDTRHILASARELHRVTHGAFDITMRPILELWKRAASEGRVPNGDELSAARERSRWEQIELTPRGAIKRVATAEIDLAGIGRGYAIDRAIDALTAAGIAGGLVDVGGDVRAFGTGPAERVWEIELRDPFEPGVWGTIRIGGRAICTRGTNTSAYEIGGNRYSHLVDPATGVPAQEIASATVLGADTVTSHGWAMALGALGEKGAALMEREHPFDVLIVTGTLQDMTVWLTPGMRERVAAPVGWPRAAEVLLTGPEPDPM